MARLSSRTTQFDRRAAFVGLHDENSSLPRDIRKLKFRLIGADLVSEGILWMDYEMLFDDDERKIY